MAPERVVSIKFPEDDGGALLDGRAVVVVPGDRADAAQAVLAELGLSPTVVSVNTKAISVSGTPLVDTWRDCDGLRVRASTMDDSDSAMIEDIPDWAAPELEIITATDEKVHRLRYRLPTEDGTIVRIGRSQAHADLVLPDRHISREHIRLTVRGQQVYVADLGSKWGSRLNKIELREEVRLRHGDVISLGKSRVRFICYYDELNTDGFEQTVLPGREDADALSALGHAGSLEAEEVEAPAVRKPPRSTGRWRGDLGLVLLAGVVVALVAFGLVRSCSELSGPPTPMSTAGEAE